jgi:ParB family chromosome partitioning protein
MQKKNSGLGRGLGALLAPNPLTAEDKGESPALDAFDGSADLDPAFGDNPETRENQVQLQAQRKIPEYTSHLQGVEKKFPTPLDVVARASTRVDEIPLGLLRPMKDQPRQSFTDETLEELATSIKTYGILQPLVAAASGDGTYTIIAGERRFRAAEKAGLKTVPVLVREKSEHTQLELALIENIQREELNPLDEARALQRLVQEHSYTQDALSARIGKDRATVANALRLLTLPEEILKDLKEKKISAGHGKALCALENKKTQLKLRDLILSRKLSVRQTEDLVKNLKKGKAEPKLLKDHLPPDLRHLCEELKSSLQMKVRISGASDKGKIEIEYFSLDDLERLSKILLGDPFANTRLPNG